PEGYSSAFDLPRSSPSSTERDRFTLANRDSQRLPVATPGVNRDIQANCPTIAMNAGEFGRANQSDHHVLQLQRQYRQESSHEGRGGFCYLAHDGQARWFR